MTRTTLFGISFIGLFFVLSVADADEEVYSQKLRDQFREAGYNSCLDKQSRSVMDARLIPVVVEEMCKCYADKTTADVFGSMDFQIAMSRKDSEAAKRVASEIMAPDAATRTMMACQKVAIDLHGGQSKIVVGKPSNQIGLKGEARRSYIDLGVLSCKDALKQTPNNNGIPSNIAEAYCKCAMNYSADRVSHAHIVDLLNRQPSAVKLQEQLTKASGNFCREMFPGIKTK